MEKRQEVLRDKQQNKRPYDKKDSSFWIHGGKQEAARKVLRVSTESPQLPAQQQPPTEQPAQQQPLTELPPTELSAQQQPPTELPPMPPSQQSDEELNEETLRRRKVPELIKLLQCKTGQSLNKRTRKPDIIAALMKYCDSQRSE